MKNISTAAILTQGTHNSQTWFKQWFDSSFYHQLYANRDEHEAASFIDELVNELRPATDSRMLDLGCGTGSTAVALARQGIRMFAVDLSPTMCRLARLNAQKKLRNLSKSVGHRIHFCDYCDSPSAFLESSIVASLLKECDREPSCPKARDRQAPSRRDQGGRRAGTAGAILDLMASARRDPSPPGHEGRPGVHRQ